MGVAVGFWLLIVLCNREHDKGVVAGLWLLIVLYNREHDKGVVAGLWLHIVLDKTSVKWILMLIMYSAAGS